jgi:hypothetical protein
VGFEQRATEQTMKRLDEGKTSLVEFMRSIRYSRHHTSKPDDYLPEHFAGLSSQTPSPQADTGKKPNAEEKSLIRSAN